MATQQKTKDINEIKKIYKYKKRPGTSGITGSLYRSHLLSLILSRNLNEATEFVYACNVDEIGVMNEICFRFHKDNREKSVAAFINTKYTGHITDDDLTNPKSTFHLYKCFQSYISIRERFYNNPDALFEGPFDNIEPYFVIYTPHQNKIKNHLAELKEDDKIFTNKINDIIGTGNNKNIFKVRAESLISVVINSTIELIGNTIAAYVTSIEKDQDEIKNDMKNVLKKYHSFLIPHVIKINEQDEHNSGEFNESLHENSNSHIQLLKKVLFTEILKKSKVVDEEANTNIQLLLETKNCTVDMLAPLIGSVITFDENSKKLVYMPGVSDCIQKKTLADIKVPKHIIEKAFIVAGMQALASIKINFNDLDIQQFITKQDFQTKQKVLESVFADEKRLAERFFNHFYIYTNQVKENDVSKLLQEIDKYHAKNKNSLNIFQNKPEVALVSFHQKVQEWMLSIDNPQYLTHSCDFVKDITVIVDPLLSVLNYNCIMELQEYPINFNSNSFNTFPKLVDTQSRVNIVTNNVLFTSIKLMQYLPGMNTSFINFEHLCNMKNIEFDKLIQEVNKSTVKILVIILCETEKETGSDKLKTIVENLKGNVFLISNHDIEDFETIFDTINSLEDIDNANELLKYEITVQGEKIELGNIIDENTIKLIDDRILSKIIKNESIGQSLCNLLYNDTKDCFVDRKLIKFNSFEYPEYENDYYLDNFDESRLMPDVFDFFSTFDEVDTKSTFCNQVFAIYAEPGMGKSTLLTNVSVKMKQAYPKKWIVRMNLLNYCNDFFKWEEKRGDVDITESMHLVCRAELNQKANKLFVLERGSKGDLVVLQSKELDSVALLVLNLIINSYNSGNMIFLFDGFDEICPHYEAIVVQFINNIMLNDIKDENSQSFNSNIPKTRQINNANKTARNQIWITSRPYNAIKTRLNREFSITSLYLKRLSTDEQYNFYKMYWETRLKMEDLSPEQFQNVESFFEYMNQYRLTDDYFKTGFFNNKSNILLRRMHEAAVYYFRSKIFTVTDENVNKMAVLNHWISPMSMNSVDDNLDVNDYNSEELQLAGVPLHMKIYADLFINQIKDTSTPKQWDMGVHTFEFYNQFLELKLKKIRLKEKAGEDVHTSDFLTEYEDLVEEVTEEHKKLAFYAFYHNISSHHKKVLPDIQWEQIQFIIERIKRAEEKTGLIDRIHDDVPRFVHLVFAEYYAVEFIADMLKMSLLTDDEVHQQIDFVVNCLLNSSEGIMRAFDHKLKNDDKLLKVLSDEYAKQCIFTVWIKPIFSDSDKNEQSCLNKVLENRSIEIAWILLKSMKSSINSANIEKIVDIIGSDFFKLSMTTEDLVVYVINAFRSVDPKMVNKALLNCGILLRELPENEVIVTKLRERYPRKAFIPASPHFIGRVCS